MKKIIEFAKYIVRVLLKLTPAGRCYYARRKERQRMQALENVQEHGPEIFRLTHEICSEYNIPYVLCYGTLLGCVRDGGIMKHDDDIDFAILPCHFNMQEFVLAMEQYGFEFFWAWTFHGKITEFAFTYHGVHVDFYLMHDDGADFITHWYSMLDGVKYPDKKHWTSVECRLPRIEERAVWHIDKYNCDVMIPKNYDEMLTRHYGSWRIPDAGWKMRVAGKTQSNRKVLSDLGCMIDRKEFFK